MKLNLGHSKNRLSIFFDKFKRVSASLLKAYDEGGRDFKIHLFAFYHHSVAGFSIARTNEREFR